MLPDPSHCPIGVFDSGIGGLTVAASLRRLLPSEKILYIGDTARVPYGGKSRPTVERYSLEIGELLLAERAKMIVVACNTASALGVPRMKEVFQVPVQGVILPGAKAAVSSTKNKTIGVIATRATIASGAYEHAIREIGPAAEIHSAACPLLVPLIEEGLFDDPVTDQILARYLAPLLSRGDAHLSAPVNLSGRLDVTLTDATEGFLRTAAQALELEINQVTLGDTARK